MAHVSSAAGWGSRPQVVMAALGLISGTVSAKLGFESYPYLSPLQPLALLFGLAPEQLPIGFCFGAVIALGVFLWTRSGWSLLVLPVTTMYAWSAAIQVAVRLQRTADDDPHLIAASLAAGAVGAGITHLGCALFSQELRRPARLAITCAVGAAAGMLLFMGQRKMIDERLLFVIWQPAVAFAIGLGLAGRGRGGAL